MLFRSRAVDEYALDPELRAELADALDGGAALAEADAALEAPAVAAPAPMRRAS